MRAQKKACPQVEAMESLVLLSGGAAAIPAHLHPHGHVTTTAGAAAGTTMTLGGTAQGVFLAPRPRRATNYTIETAGMLTPTGSTTVFGNLKVVTRRSSGPPSGTLHLLAGNGTLTLRIPGSAMIPAGLPAPTTKGEIVDTYAITGGTGAYAGDTGSGVVEFTFSPANPGGAKQVGRASIAFTTLNPTPAS